MRYLVAASLLAWAVLCSHTFPLGAGEPPPFPKGARAVAFKLPEGQKAPEGVVPLALVDVVGKIHEPIETAVILQGVKVWAVDTIGVGGGPDTISIMVQVTPTQAKVLALLNEDGVEFGVKLLSPPMTTHV